MLLANPTLNRTTAIAATLPAPNATTAKPTHDGLRVARKVKGGKPTLHTAHSPSDVPGA